MRQFYDLIDELSEFFNEPLIAEVNDTCKLLVNEKIEVQIEMDFMGEFIIIAAIISELPPGKFRENILKDALKSNHLIDSHRSFLAYIGVNNQLIVSENLFAHAITAEQLYNNIIALTKRAKKWQDAINRGETSPQDQDEMPIAQTKGKQQLFGFTVN